MQRGISRRHMLELGATTAGGAVLVACGATPGDGAAPKATGPVTGAVELMWSNETTTLEFLEKDWIPGFKREHPRSDITLAVVPGSWDDLYRRFRSPAPPARHRH